MPIGQIYTARSPTWWRIVGQMLSDWTHENIYLFFFFPVIISYIIHINQLINNALLCGLSNIHCLYKACLYMPPLQLPPCPVATHTSQHIREWSRFKREKDQLCLAEGHHQVLQKLQKMRLIISSWSCDHCYRGLIKGEMERYIYIYIYFATFFSA